MRQNVVRVLLGLGALGAFVAGCKVGPDDLAPDDALAVVEALEGRLTLCDSAEHCRDVNEGDPIEPGRLLAEGGTRARVSGRGLHLTLGPEAVVRLASVWTIEEGDVLVDVEPSAEAGLMVHDQLLKFAVDRPATVLVSADRERATLAMRRGKLALERGGETIVLSRGQSAELAASGIQPRYLPSSAPAPEVAAHGDEPTRAVALRGLGRMTARRPGTEAVVAGVVLAKHDVSVLVRDGVATTTVEEVFENQTNEVLEGRFVFPVPAAASVSDLVLWVGDQPVSAELVEKKRAAQIFKGIVDDTVRPRDPALLEWSQGRELSLKIFPIAAKGSRRVRFSFEQPVFDLGGRGRLVYPLSAGADRATRIRDLSLRVRIEGSNISELSSPAYPATVTTDAGWNEVTFNAHDFEPIDDFVVTYLTEPASGALAMVEPATPCEGSGAACPPQLAGATIVRSLVENDAQSALPPPVRADRVIVIDRSASQTLETLAAQTALAKRVLSGLDPDERFAILACDSACETFPADGLAAPSAALTQGAEDWLSRLTAGGASDIGGSLEQGLLRLAGSPSPQLLVLGDGVASAGQLTVDGILRRLDESAVEGTDVRIVGVGRNVDELALRALARGLGGTFDAFDGSSERTAAVEAVAFSLAQPVLRDIEVDLPVGVSLAVDAPASLRLGDELRLAVVGEPEGGELLIRGRLGGEDFEQRSPITRSAGPRGFASRSVARAQIDALEGADDAGSDELVVELSKTFFVMSRQTSLLVLENDAMFRSFGIERTRGGRPVSAPRVRMGGSAAPELPFNPFVELPPTASGSLWGSQLGDAFGAGGLGLSGVGEGGGGLGLGAIGTLGHGAGMADASGFGNGRLSGSHATHAPSVRMGRTSVSGRLPPEVIQRIVRQNFGRFRLCYENALRKDPAVAGRVVVSFVIGTEGNVAAASGGVSDIGDAAMVACVVGGFRGLSFPQPEGGQVTVTYPIVFAPDGGASPQARRSPWVPPPPQLTDGDDAWTRAGSDTIARLEADVARDESRRSARAALVRGLIARGRFADAVKRASDYAALDPDQAAPLDLLAQALLANGEIERSATVLDSLAEIDRSRLSTHVRIARAFEARGDERRACAHWISVLSLRESDDARREAWRCRARVGERDRVLDEITMYTEKRGNGRGRSALVELSRAIRAGETPAYAWPAVANDDVHASVACSAERSECPIAVTVDGQGRVLSDHLPDADGRRFANGTFGGTFRVLVVGGRNDARVVAALAMRGVQRKVELRRAERATALVARVEATGLGFGTGFGR